MRSWHPPCYQRATAYVTDPSGRLLVFDHVGIPKAGTQVPAGGVQPDEDHQSAVRRELFEESGIDDARLVRQLGESWYVAEVGNVPAGYEEQIQHAFHFVLDDVVGREVWEWDECDGGTVAKHRFAFRWVSVEEAAAQLWPIQAMWIASLRCSLRNMDGS